MAEKVKFSPVMRLGEAEFMTHMTGSELLRLWLDGIIEYNPEIQRGSKIKLDKDKNEIKVPVFSTANVKKIYQAMLDGNYFTDLITLNIMKDGTEQVEVKKNALVVNRVLLPFQTDAPHPCSEAIKMSNDALETALI